MKQLTIQEFVQKTIIEIENSLPEGYSIDDAIEFEISVTTNEEKDGGVDLRVFSGKLSDSKQVVQKINFSIINSLKKDLDSEKAAEHAVKYIGKGLQELYKVNANSSVVENLPD